MPTAAPKICTGGCGALVDGGGRCPRCKTQNYKKQDERRGNSSQRGYDAVWRKIREQHLKEEPLCRFCKQNGIIKAANEVDHIDGDVWNREDENLRSLCKPCHSARTMRDQVNK